MNEPVQPGHISPDGFYVWDGRQWMPRQTVPGPVFAPAYMVPAGLPAWTRPYESAWPQSRAAVWALRITGFAAIFALLMSGAAAVYTLVSSGSLLSSDQKLIFSLLVVAGAGPYLVCFIVTAVLFLIWLHRVTRNLPLLGTYRPRFSPGFAVAGWFIPFWSFVHGFLAVREVWRGSDPSFYASDPAMRASVRTWGLLFAWWLMWAFGNLASFFGNANPDKAIGNIVFAQGMAAVSFLLLASAALAGATIVHDVTTRQVHKASLIASGQLR